ncbi:MAG: aminodeoxychorismate synthase component I [Clostridiaceae bacterium]|nr:aminodeoxychorismate synthase component I [Clostridiaceae bacterium]
MEIVLKETDTLLNSFDVYSIFKDEKNVVFLDSGRDFESLGRYSFIGLNPFKIIKGRHNRCNIDGTEYVCDIFLKLSELLNKYKAHNNTDIPFIGGCMGYFSYDLGLELEGVIGKSKEDLIIPHYYFMFYDNLIIFDNKSGKKFISACGMNNKHHKSISLIEERISKQKKVEGGQIKRSAVSLNSNFTEQEYVETVRKVKEYIENGDIYIANLTQRYTAHTDKDSYEIFRDLRNINPAPFAAFMRLDDFEVISSSPERFLRVIDNNAETRPIKGTMPRGKTIAQDEHNRDKLINSSKDKAELLMIVDLERNDLSKVCKPHTVKVNELFRLEEYSTVFHLVAAVSGELKETVDSVHCLKACFPGGSITGAPKLRSMEIIDELEGVNRGLYTGCIGYFSFDGNADFNIVIRTIIKKDSRVYFGVGGGITWHSVEEAEYQETLHKADALMRVI